MSAIAELERALIAERVRAGLRRARADGKRLGRPPLQIDPRELKRVIRTRMSAREAARELEISPSASQRLMKARQGVSGVRSPTVADRAEALG